ncbi:putative transposon protein [Tanacetum coccineum]
MLYLVIKVPSGYSANIKNLVSMKDLKLLGMKSHDCHVLLTQMIPIAIRGLMPPQVRQTITKLCLFFNMIHSKVLDHEKLEELYMGFLKGYVRNRYRPEGSIIQGYVAEEVVQFCTNYMDDVTDIGLPQPRHQGRLEGVGTIGRKDVMPNTEDLEQAHFTQQDDKSTVQNSGVSLIATTTDSSRMTIAKNSYYGVIDEIWELDYTTVVIPILKCKWVDNTRGVKVDNDGFTCVNLSTNGYLSDPFILAKQATQVFYVEDPKDKRWHIVLQSKRSIVGVDDVVDEDEYNKFDELPPFFIGFESDAVLSDTIYLRSDHQEGQED